MIEGDPEDYFDKVLFGRIGICWHTYLWNDITFQNDSWSVWGKKVLGSLLEDIVITYTHHFILQNYGAGLVTKDTLESLPYSTPYTLDVKDVEDHWTEQNGTPMICVNVYVKEDV